MRAHILLTPYASMPGPEASRLAMGSKGRPMSRVLRVLSFVVKIVCIVTVALLLPRFVEFVVIAPKAAFEAIGHQMAMQMAGIAGFIVAVWAAPAWTVYFGWRTIRTWRSPSCVPALMMALPAVLALTLAFVAIAVAG